jgi:hypothetical protein
MLWKSSLPNQSTLILIKMERHCLEQTTGPNKMVFLCSGLGTIGSHYIINFIFALYVYKLLFTKILLLTMSLVSQTLSTVSTSPQSPRRHTEIIVLPNNDVRYYPQISPSIIDVKIKSNFRGYSPARSLSERSRKPKQHCVSKQRDVATKQGGM